MVNKNPRKPRASKDAPQNGTGKTSPPTIPVKVNPTQRLNALAMDFLDMLELAIKRQDNTTILQLVGKNQNLVPALNALHRIIQQLKKEDDSEHITDFVPENETVKGELSMNEHDCYATIHFCLRRLCFLRFNNVYSDKATKLLAEIRAAVEMWEDTWRNGDAS